MIHAGHVHGDDIIDIDVIPPLFARGVQQGRASGEQLADHVAHEGRRLAPDVLLRAVNIVVARDDDLDPVVQPERAAQLLRLLLGHRVDQRRRDRVVLTAREVLAVLIDGGGAGHHHAAHVAQPRRLKHLRRAGDVHADRLRGRALADRQRGDRGQVEHRVCAVEHAANARVPDVHLVEGAEHRAIDGKVLAVAVAEVVQQVHVVACTMQVEAELRADEPGGSGDDDFPRHRLLLPNG